MVGVTLSKEHTDFSEIVRRAYEKGTSDVTITLDKLIEEIKLDLQKLRAD